MAELLSMIRKTVQATNADPDAWEVVASDETVDRYGDIIRAEGWELRNYAANPIVLFGHSSMQPIGTSNSRIEGKRLVSTIKLADEGTSPQVDYYRALIKQKILRATSVGFMPTKAVVPILDKDKRITGFEYNGQELLELSVVSVPANPAAVSLAKSFNLNPATVLPRGYDESASAFLHARRCELELLRLLGAPAR
jgi:HK97 family phage prohead protease